MKIKLTKQQKSKICGIKDFKLVVSRNHSLAIKRDLSLWAWGGNYDGQLGIGGATSYEKYPIQVGIEYSWFKVSVGMSHSLAIKVDGTLWAWGANYYGQLGDGGRINSTNPKQIGEDTDWEQVIAGSHHSIAIKRNSEIFWWGDERDRKGFLFLSQDKDLQLTPKKLV